MYGYNAGQPMAIPIYTVLPYCVIHGCTCTGVVTPSSLVVSHSPLELYVATVISDAPSQARHSPLELYVHQVRQGTVISDGQVPLGAHASSGLYVPHALRT